MYRQNRSSLSSFDPVTSMFNAWAVDISAQGTPWSTEGSVVVANSVASPSELDRTPSLGPFAESRIGLSIV